MNTSQIWLKVAEADGIISAIKNAKSLKRLDGRQRQLLETAIASLTEARQSAIRGRAKVPVETVLELLRCIAFLQGGLDGFFPDFGG
jgi:hypothetical protein